MCEGAVCIFGQSVVTFFHGRQSLIYLEGLQTSIGDQVVPAAFER